MEVKIHAYRGITTPLYNFVNLHINLYEHTDTINPPDCINYWLADVLYEHTTTLDDIVPRGFFNGNPNNYMVLQLSQEGMGLKPDSPTKSRIDRIVQNVPVDKIIALVNCPQQAEYLKRFYPSITHVAEFNFLELLTRSYMPPRPFEPDTANSRRFLYLNRRNYTHRSLLFGKLWQEPNFVNNSYTSFSPGTYWDSDTRSSENPINNPVIDQHLSGILRDLNHDYPDVVEWFKKQTEFPCLPGRYSSSNPYEYNFFSKGLAQAHADTSINLVVESNAYRIEQGFFSTEKIYRPIASGQAFIVLAQPGYYENLRRLGYETYESIFNEKHDSIANDFERCASVARTVQRLARMESGEFAALMERTRRIRKHNHRVFLQRTSLASVALNFTGPLEPLRPLLRYSVF